MTQPLDPPPARELPAVLVAGAACRDIVEDDPRGWRLGGGVSYSALTVARLGLPTRAVVGVDDEAATADELDLLIDAGVELVLVPLRTGPVFVNIERPEGRLQVARQPSDPLPVGAIPHEWRGSRGWLLAPVADELPDAWAGAPPADAIVAVGWQGLLRELVPDEPVGRVEPGPGPIVHRADLASISREDVHPGTPVDALVGYLRDGATLVVTQGDRGGIVATSAGGRVRLRHYPAVRSPRPVDPTGAGDTFLAALVAAWVEPRLVGGRTGGQDLLLAAAAASLVLEGEGLRGVPDREAVARRMAEGATAFDRGAGGALG
ncbi:MAG TPA: PfkB family carbohydrate kinase [Candidatus Limnocylindrales bacterium]|nr:PfkB family carbohydrate kinase [Candidatus Limnocylindrales bacterium]